MDGERYLTSTSSFSRWLAAEEGWTRLTSICLKGSVMAGVGSGGGLVFVR